MTATASPPGKPPPPLPPPPSSPHKPMPRRGDCLWGLASCFGGSPVADSDAGHPVDHRNRRSSSWLTWSNFRRKKKKKQKTVRPVEAPPAGELAAPGKKAAGDDRGAPEAAGGVEKAAGGGRHVQNEVEKEGSTMKQHRRRTAASPAKKPPAAATESLGQIIRFFEKLGKGNKDKSGPMPQICGSHTDEVSKSDHRHRRPPPQQQQQIRLACLSTKYDARHVPPARTAAAAAAAAAACCTAPPSSPGTAPPPRQYSITSPAHGAAAASRLGCVRTQKNTTLSELEPPLSLRPGRNDQLLGLSVMAVVLVMMVLFGRVTAVLFTCLWLYCLPRVRATMAEPEGAAGSRSAAAGIDLDSGEYKKKVVLEGLLQRHGRRSPGLQ